MAWFKLNQVTLYLSSSLTISALLFIQGHILKFTEGFHGNLSKRTTTTATGNPTIRGNLPPPLPTPVAYTSGTLLDEDDLFMQGNYFTIHQDLTFTSLVVLHDGKVQWQRGMPTLYSVFHEQVYQEKSSHERMYSLEALATRHWLCMTGKGKLYTIKQPSIFRLKDFNKQGRIKIRHGRGRKKNQRKKISTGRGRGFKRGGRNDPNPPSDCLFQTYEFDPHESYERSIGIYSFSHSNQTHGRFLSINPNNGTARTFRKRFRQLSQFPQIKITQVPIRYLKEMIESTRFGRGREFNHKVRSCLIILFSCPNHRRKIAQGNKGSLAKITFETRKKQAHFFRLIERCKKRAKENHGLPTCHEHT